MEYCKGKSSRRSGGKHTEKGSREGCQGREERTFRTRTVGTSCRRLAEGHDKSSKYKGGEVKLVTTNIVARRRSDPRV